MLTLFPKVPKTQGPKAVKIDVVDCPPPPVVWRSLSRKPPQMFP